MMSSPMTLTLGLDTQVVYLPRTYSRSMRKARALSAIMIFGSREFLLIS